MIKLVVTDIDDTLVARKRRVITHRGLAAIHALLDAGVVCGPATGRDVARVAYSYRFDPACYSTAIVANGMRIYHGGQKILEKVLPQEGLQRIAELCAKDDRADLLLFGDNGLIWACGTDIDTMAEHDLKHLVNCEGVSVDAPEDSVTVKANLHFDGSIEELLAFKDELVRCCPEIDFTCPCAGIIDITTHGWDKGEAALWLARYLGIEPDEICAFGDAGNDEALIQKIPNSVAVANAFDEIVDEARWHIGTTMDDAVSEAFEDIAEAAATGTMPRFMSEDVDAHYREAARSYTAPVPKGMDS